MDRTTNLLVIVIFAVTTFGCAPYVNIPPQEGDVAMHSPNSRTVRNVTLAAIHQVLEHRPIREPFQVILPPGTDQVVYAQMLPKISEDAMWSSDQQMKGLPVLKVSHVRIRGMTAEVDIVHPAFPSDQPSSMQVITVKLKYDPISKWKPYGVQEYRGDLRVTEPARQPQPEPQPESTDPQPTEPQSIPYEPIDDGNASP